MDPAGPAALPLITAWIMIIIGAVLLAGGSLAARKAVKSAPRSSVASALRGFADRYRLVLVVIFFCLAYSFMYEILGYLIMTPLLIGSIMWVLGYRNKRSLMMVSGFMTAILFVVFRFGLTVKLPLGFWEKLF